MNEFLVILVMAGIGAIIGGVTNSLAIKMLFRPYQAVYIAGKRVPFTPGLIPKRREELATQLGRMVTEHLLTPESIRKKFQDPIFKREMEKWAQEEVGKILSSDRTLQDIANNFGYNNLAWQSEEKMKAFIEKKYLDIINQNNSKQIQVILPTELQAKIESKLPGLSSYITVKGIEYFNSDEGKRRLRKMIDDFLAKRGMLGNMLQMFLGNESLVDKVQPEILKFLQNPGTSELITSLLSQEWDKVKSKELSEIEEKIGRKQILEILTQQALKIIPVSEYVSKPINQLVTPYRDVIVSSWVPQVIEMVGNVIADRIEKMMERLHLAEIVKNQVETFAVERLEDMVLSISRREFKMITYLGALLGGLIGVVQGLLVTLL